MFRPSRSPSPSSLPLTTKPTPRYSTSRRSIVTFFGTAAVSGIVFHILFFGFGGNEAVREVPVLKDWIPPPKAATTHVIYQPCPESTPTPSRPVAVPDAALSSSTSSYDPMTHPGQATDLEMLRKMVDRTKGFYGRDYSLGLGWNNMRYIIEAALEQAALLNRTLVVPSFVYARSCEWEINSCAAFAPMVNRGDAIGWGEWRHLPIEKQMGWRIPMDVMIDLPHLRQRHNVLLMSEYLRLNDIDPAKEWSNGAFHRTDYLGEGEKKLTIHVIRNGDYDPSETIRVDHREPLIKAGSNDAGPLNLKLWAAMSEKHSKDVIDWSDAKEALKDHMSIPDDADELQRLIEENNWVVLHTFAGTLGMDYLKSAVEPIKQVAPVSRIRGWIDDYNHITTDILVLEGETHLGRKPGGMRFATIAERDEFARTVLYDLRPIEKIRHLATKVDQRMKEKVGGRMWMAGHMRRGDFVTAGWAMESTIEAHFERIKGKLQSGRKILETIQSEQEVTPFPIPDVRPDMTQLSLEPPREGDVFYLATDERSPEGIKFMKDNGGIFIDDLLTINDRREFGWGIMVTDVLALVEQAVLSHGYYFYAHAMSSVAGGAVNMRAARGADVRSTLID